MPGRSSSVSERLRSLRAEALSSGRRLFQLVECGGVRVERPRTLGEFGDVVSALDAARRFGVSSCVVREWASLDSLGIRVHVNSVEWLLSWQRVAALRPQQATEGRADSTGGPQGLPVGRERSVTRSDVNPSKPFDFYG